MDIYANFMSLISALFGLALVLAGGLLWPWGITELAWASVSVSVSSVVMLKAFGTVVLTGYGARRFFNALG